SHRALSEHKTLSISWIHYRLSGFFLVFPDNPVSIALRFISCRIDNSFFLSSSRSAALAFPLHRRFSAGRHKLN
ncbi:hypothetical protein, partial [Pantoea septica]|uniref:hypothetical protein n=1 Tax=Pantoea septica TaxID=472695 RepID=UPI00289C254F